MPDGKHITFFDVCLGIYTHTFPLSISHLRSSTYTSCYSSRPEFAPSVPLLVAPGGYVYRGQQFSDLLDGAYIFGDQTNQ